MSSWIVAKNRPTKKKPSVTKYHDTSSATDVFSMYMELVGSYIYSQKMGETCNVFDAGGLVKSTLKINPQVKLLKEKPETDVLTTSDYKGFVSKMSFKDIQKLASSLIVYDASLNQTVIRSLEKAGIRAAFDIGIHLTKNPAGPDLGLFKRYAALIKAYQVKAKKDTLAIYVMSDSYSEVSHFQTYCDPSWKITSLSKNPAKDSDGAFIQRMADMQIMTAVPNLILDFERSEDRFIYLMQRNVKLSYFVELNDEPWKLL
jgi:hypothetical protein